MKHRSKKYSDSLQYMNIFLYFSLCIEIAKKKLSIENSTERSIRINPRDCSIDVDCEHTILNTRTVLKTRLNN